MNDTTRDSLVYELSERNRLINELRREIDTIYLAAGSLIQHAKTTTEGQAALRQWDKQRPKTHHGKKL